VTLTSKSRFAITTLFCICGITAHADDAWNEAANGDLSNNGLSPTGITLNVGSNRVLGSTGNNGSGIDRDYFTFTVPAGRAVTAITLLNNTYVSGGASFIGLQAGPQITVSPSGSGADQLIGYTHYGTDLIGTNLLPLIAHDYSNGLTTSTYSVWIQETGGPVEYGLDFTLVPLPVSEDVPMLPGWTMILLGTSLFVLLWRRNKQLLKA